MHEMLPLREREQWVRNRSSPTIIKHRLSSLGRSPRAEPCLDIYSEKLLEALLNVWALPPKPFECLNASHGMKNKQTREATQPTVSTDGTLPMLGVERKWCTVIGLFTSWEMLRRWGEARQQSDRHPSSPPCVGGNDHPRKEITLHQWERGVREQGGVGYREGLLPRYC